MVVDVLPVRVRCHHKGVLALGKTHGQFVAYFVSLLCGDFPRTEGLPYLISDYIAFLPSSVHKVVLPFGEHKPLGKKKRLSYKMVASVLSSIDFLFAIFNVLPDTRSITVYYISKWVLVIFAIIPFFQKQAKIS